MQDTNNAPATDQVGAAAPEAKRYWTNADEKYVIENYDRLGPTKVSQALNRSYGTVAERVRMLRKANRMPRPLVRRHFRRSETPSSEEKCTEHTV